jgi:hypothetical protein
MATISFDFDDTLMWIIPCPEWGTREGGLNETTVAAMRAHADAGDKIIIVTSRHEKWEHLDEPWRPSTVAGFVAEHNLPVEEIHFTNGEFKAPLLVKLGVVKHFDDDEDELAQLPDSIEGVLVPEHPDWNKDNLFD